MKRTLFCSSKSSLVLLSLLGTIGLASSSVVHADDSQEWSSNQMVSSDSLTTEIKVLEDKIAEQAQVVADLENNQPSLDTEAILQGDYSSAYGQWTTLDGSRTQTIDATYFATVSNWNTVNNGLQGTSPTSGHIQHAFVPAGQDLQFMGGMTDSSRDRWVDSLMRARLDSPTPSNSVYYRVVDKTDLVSASQKLEELNASLEKAKSQLELSRLAEQQMDVSPVASSTSPVTDTVGQSQTSVQSSENLNESSPASSSITEIESSQSSITQTTSSSMVSDTVIAQSQVSETTRENKAISDNSSKQSKTLPNTASEFSWLGVLSGLLVLFSIGLLRKKRS